MSHLKDVHAGISSLPDASQQSFCHIVSLPTDIISAWRAKGFEGSHLWSLACFAATHEAFTSRLPDAALWRVQYSTPTSVQRLFELGWSQGFGHGAYYGGSLVNKTGKAAWTGPIDMCEVMAAAGMDAGTFDIISGDCVAGNDFAAAAKQEAVATILYLTGGRTGEWLPVLEQSDGETPCQYILGRAVRGNQYFVLWTAGGALKWSPVAELFQRRIAPHQIMVVKPGPSVRLRRPQVLVLEGPALAMTDEIRSHALPSWSR